MDNTGNRMTDNASGHDETLRQARCQHAHRAADRVARIRTLLRLGSYRVPGPDVADPLLRAHLAWHVVRQREDPKPEPGPP